jgi:hypothetical protein
MEMELKPQREYILMGKGDPEYPDLTFRGFLPIFQ